MSSPHDSPGDVEPASGARSGAANGRDRSSNSAETRERLLDAAEHLFANRGFEGTSMRAITQAAGTSVSAANYHFGSKEKLLHETIRRATEPVNARRLEMLDAAEALAGGEPLALETILEAYLRPSIEYRQSDSTSQGRQITARLFSDPPELIQSIKHEVFGPMSHRFGEALTAALPERAPLTVELGYQFLIAIMVYVISDQIESSTLTATHPEGVDDDVLLQTMIDFAAAGLRALPPV
jgi:AcrR family transcriptional regulator